MKRRLITLLVIVLIAVLLALLFFFWQSGSIKVSHTYRLVRFSTATTTQGAADTTHSPGHSELNTSTIRDELRIKYTNSRIAAFWAIEAWVIRR